MDPNVAFWVPLGATFLLSVAGIWISIRMARISSTLANLTEEAKSIKATVDRIENKHFDLTKELATRNEYISPETIEPIIEQKIKDAFGPISDLMSTKNEITRFAASTSQSVIDDISKVSFVENTNKSEPTFSEKLMYIMKSTNVDEIRKALEKQKEDKKKLDNSR
jgi:hypothetical protein